MKKNKIFLLSLLAVALSFSSCSDEDIMLDSPNNLTTNNFFKTQEDFDIAIRGVYNDFRTNGLFGNTGQARDIIILGDLMSDNLVFNPTGRRGGYTASYWAYQANSDITDIYTSSYKAISDANVLLSKIDNLPAGADKERVRSEALALRALAHFEVAKLYAQIPTQGANAKNSQGIAYIDKYDPTGVPAREANIGIVYDKIIKDLETALVGLPATASSVYNLNQLSVKGFLAKAYLYKGDYNKVIEYATPVVAAVKPASKEALSKIWTTESNEGVLMAFAFPLSTDIQIGTNYSQGLTDAQVKLEFSVDKAFYDTYNATTEPERLNSSIRLLNNGADAGAPSLAVKKYMYSRTGLNAGINDGRFLRVEDVILSLAEAQYMSGNAAGALTTLNILRNVRYTSYTGGETGNNLFEAIISERRKELAFEIGDRFFTLKRLLGVSGIPAKYALGIQRSGLGHRADGSGTPSVQQQLPANSVKWQLPIPQSVVNLDPVIGQTTGY